MAKPPIMNEEGLAARVVAYYDELGFTAYQEVQVVQGGPRVDAVFQRDSTLYVVECKLVLSFDLLAQARHWKPYATGVFIAVPKPRETTAGRQTALDCVAGLGLGCLEVESLWPVDEGRRRAVVQRRDPEILTSFHPELLRSLRPEHQTHAKAGTNQGSHFTRFKLTCDNVRRCVEAEPGIALRSALAQVDHHYFSLDSGSRALRDQIVAGDVPGLSIDSDDILTLVSS
jgi:hypothetical protein